jgi:hypothetical protein
MSSTTSGSKSTAARSGTRPGVTSRPARPVENRPAVVGAGRAGTLTRARPGCPVRRAQVPGWHALGQAARRRLESGGYLRRAAGSRTRPRTTSTGPAWSEVDEMIWQAVHAGFEYFQRVAGYTRTGSHNKRVHDRETGQWQADLSVAHWLQHKSRDGDMQLDVHSQIAHVAAPSPTGTGGARIPRARTSVSPRSPRSPPSAWRRHLPSGSVLTRPPVTTGTSARSRALRGADAAVLLAT